MKSGYMLCSPFNLTVTFFDTYELALSRRNELNLNNWKIYKVEAVE